MEKFIKIVKDAKAILDYLNDKAAKAGKYVHNPINHVEGNCREGDSIFDPQVQTFEDILALISVAKDVSQKPGDDGATCYVFEARVGIGTEKWLEAVDQQDGYEIQEIHGSLVPVGNAIEHAERTSFFTVCLTPEHTGDGDVEYAFASVYPGWPQKKADRSGLKVGDRLTAKQVTDRNLRIKLPVKS